MRHLDVSYIQPHPCTSCTHHIKQRILKRPTMRFTRGLFQLVAKQLELYQLAEFARARVALLCTAAQPKNSYVCVDLQLTSNAKLAPEGRTVVTQQVNSLSGCSHIGPRKRLRLQQRIGSV
ncbi:hypothetical protein Plhal304r1_c002g0008951 [Plasmopara halstedii]